MKLSGPDFFEWKGLRRARRGGLARGDDHYYDHGNPVPGWLIPDIVDGLLKDGLLELGDPDESGMRRVTLTEAGLAHYRVLCKRQRRKDAVVGAMPVESPDPAGCTASTEMSKQRIARAKGLALTFLLRHSPWSARRRRPPAG